MEKEQMKAIEETLAKYLKETVESVKTDLAGIVEEKIKAHLKEVGSPDFSRLPVAPGSVAEKEAKYAKIGEFIKSVFKNDIAALAKGMTESVDSDGGFTVPTELHNEVMRLATDYGLVAKFAFRFPMGSDKLDVPTGANSVTVYWPGEASNITASTPTFGNAQLVAQDLAGLVITSNQLLADSRVSIVDYLLGLLAEAFAGEIDNQAFNGTGTPFTGILNDSNVTVVTMASGQDTFAETKLGDLRDLVSNVPTVCLPTSIYIMHRLTWGTIQKIQENSQTVAAFQNQPISQGLPPDQLKGLTPAGYLWGFPVYTSDKMVSTSAVSTKFVIFGSLTKGLFWGDREQATMKISQEATVSGTNLFQSNQSALRLVQRLAVKVGLPTAFAVLKTAAS